MVATRQWYLHPFNVFPSYHIYGNLWLMMGLRVIYGPKSDFGCLMPDVGLLQLLGSGSYHNQNVQKTRDKETMLGHGS